MQENINGMRNVQIKDREEHLMLCPNQDRTRLRKEQTKSLEEWLHKDDQNRNSQLTYWIPKYIQMRGTTQLLKWGTCQPQCDT